MPPKIIIIEDDEDTVDIMSCILAEQGYEIIFADNGKFLDEVHIHQPVLILMDNRLTGDSGEDICRQFKSNPANKQYPVVLVSANINLESMAVESQADGWLRKPFDIAELLAVVKSFN